MPANDTITKRKKRSGFRPPNTPLEIVEWLVWTYFALLIIEGAMRKWFLAPLATPLLIVRDPVVFLIYLLAMRSRIFPNNAFMGTAFFLAIVSLFFSLFSSETKFVVTLYGLRINFFHLPLIFIIARLITRDKVMQLGRVILWLSLPMTAIIILQFFSSQESFINQQVGGAEGIRGALGRFRPSGTFSFITGVAAFYPLVTAFALGIMIEGKSRYQLLCLASLLCTFMSVFFSISRLNAISCALVLIAACIAFFRLRNPPKVLMRSLIFGTVILTAVSLLPFFEEGVKTFQARWQEATTETDGGIRKALLGRFFDDNFVYPYHTLMRAPLTGNGIGIGSNVGAKFLTGKLGFSAGESEWQKIIFELGPFLGLGFIALRISLFLHMLRRSFIALRRNDALPFLLFSASGLLILSGQWGPPTILGFAVFGSGLCLASSYMPLKKAQPQAGSDNQT